MFGKKKKYLEYTFVNKNYNTQDNAEILINDILEPSSPKSSCWWSSLKTTHSNKWRNYSEYLKVFQRKSLSGEHPELFPTINTAKTCPGILGILSNSYLVKSPADITITFDSNGQFIWNSSNDLISISDGHKTYQYLTNDENDIFKNKIAIKFEIGIMLKTSDSFIHTQPQYHNDMWYDVAIGLVGGKYIDGVPLSIIAFVDKPSKTETYEIKHGDVLAYL